MATASPPESIELLRKALRCDLPEALAREIEAFIAKATKPDLWSRFLAMPYSGSRSALGKLVRQHGKARVDAAISIAIASNPDAAMPYLVKVLARMNDASISIDAAGSQLPPAI